MSFETKILALVMEECQAFGRARWMRPADFEDFVHEIFAEALEMGAALKKNKGYVWEDGGYVDHRILDELDTLVKRTVWRVYKATTRNLERRRRLLQESQAKAARLVTTETSAQQRKILAEIVALAESNLTPTDHLAITDRDALRSRGMTEGAIRTQACRAIKKLRDAAAIAGVLSLLVIASVVGFVIGSCRASQRSESTSTAPGLVQSCRASQGMVKTAVAGLQSCRASQRSESTSTALASFNRAARPRGW